MDMSATIVPLFMQRIQELGITVLTKHTLKEVIETGVVVHDDQDQEKTLEADTIVMAVGALPNNELAQELQQTGIEVLQAGDCAQERPRKLIDAIHEGYFAALKI